MAACSPISCNSDPTPSWKYHVFLSFRGKDTRYNFVDHLYAALWRKGIITFRDDDELERGKVIKDELLQAIKDSLFSIVILSENYASSTWCLDELQKILESSKELHRGVLPVFYGIDPSIVRHQIGSFAEAFKRHQKRFGESSNKVKGWRNALSEIANLSGYDSKNRPETELIEEIIITLWKCVGPTLSSYSKDGLFGIDKKLENLYQILEIGSSEVRFVGIWGLGGVGKTTLAELVFNQLHGHFDVSFCLERVREKSNAIDGLLGLQKELLSKLKIKNLEIHNLDQGKAIIKNLLSHRKVLLLLDDVDEIWQLKNLTGNRDWFGQGSRVMVTTRDMHLLESYEAPFRKYEIEVLDIDESLELFHHKAFKRNQPRKDHLKWSRIVVEYAQGLPLALEVLGSLFCGRDISIWEDIISSIRKDPPKNVLDTLKISYEGLDDAVKTIFLDIACFFKGWDKDQVVQILESCGFNHKIGIQILIERSMLRYENGCFQMHDLLQEMGRKIVIQNSDNQKSRQSRLWSSKDIDEVLKKQNEETKCIEGIVLGDHNYEARWDPNAFVNMCNLRILIILHGFPLSLGLKCISDSLKVLEWNGYPFESLPRCEELNKLAELKMHGSRIKQLWNGTPNFEDLKFIDLSYSKYLIRSPNFVGVPNLESLILEGCSKLVEIHESVGQLKKLVVLNLKDCINLKCLPSTLEMTSLKYLILSGCSALGSSNTRGRLPLLERMFGRQRPPMTLNISGLSMLRKLDASFCNLRDGSIPDDLSCLSSLEKLNLSGNYFANLPLNCISNLSLLWRLDLRFCPKLQSLPVFPPSLRQVSARNCGRMEPLPADQLSKLFMFDDEELRKPLRFGLIGGRKYVISVPGSEIPVWFDKDKQKDIEGGDPDYILGSWARHNSFIVDIPNFCRSNNCKWWGIVVCFLFEPFTCYTEKEMSGAMWQLCLTSTPPEYEELPPVDSRTRYYAIEDTEGGFNFHHQYIVLLSGNDDYIQQILREGHNQLKLYVSTTRVPQPITISKCAWRVICYENEVWPKAAITDSENMASNSSHENSLREARFTEINLDKELPAERRKLKWKILD